MENVEYLNIAKAAAYIGVSKDTLRLWDKNGKLKPSRTVGGHRRYEKQELDCFKLGEMRRISYGDLYDHLCSAQFIADELGDNHAEDILRIREDIGLILLNIHNKRFKYGM